MDFGNTPATKLTERIMADIGAHLQKDEPGQPGHYNAVYSSVHRHVLAFELVGNLARKIESQK